jgi:hypothetical protein
MHVGSLEPTDASDIDHPPFPLVSKIHHRGDVPDTVYSRRVAGREGTDAGWCVLRAVAINAHVICHGQPVDLDAQELALGSEHLVHAQPRSGEDGMIWGQDPDAVASGVLFA